MELEADHVVVRFGPHVALNDVSLEVPAGSQLVVWGPAGGGKTTLLKALAGLVRVTSGAVRWAGDEVDTNARQALAEKQRAFGMIFQSDALFDSMTVLQNVRFPLIKRGVAAAEAEARARAALDDVGLAQAADKLPESLSGGMKKRAGIARAIVARPEVLLADDPFAGLDPDTERTIAEVLLRVAHGRTLIAALPDPVPSLPIERTLRLAGGVLTEPP